MTLNHSNGVVCLDGPCGEFEGVLKAILGYQTHPPPSSMTHGGVEGCSEASILTWPAVAAVQIAYHFIWFNGTQVLESRTCQRSWPAAFPAEVELEEGQNDVLVRIDLMTDHLALEIGFKRHEGQHSHQSHWDTTLVPMS